MAIQAWPGKCSRSSSSARLAALAMLCLIPCSAAMARPPAMVKVPGGALEPFWIAQAEKGKEAEKPVPIPVPALESQPTAVTNAEFLVFLRNRPEWRKSRVSPLFADESYLSQFSGDLRLKKGISPGAPVTFVSWFAALAYCEHLGLRLPTVNEWEYMAAASETTADANRDPAFLSRILEWYGKPKKGELPKVRSTYKNVYGLYDMHGLIWEWVEDFNSTFITGESREDSSLNRDLFCGSGNLFGGNKENYAAFMRFAFRSSLKGKGSVWNLGFRCAR